MKKQQNIRVAGRSLHGITARQSAKSPSHGVRGTEPAELAKVRADVRHLRKQIQEKKRKIEEVSRLAESRQEAIRELETRLHKEMHKLADMESSLGWRLLKPLNFASRFVGGLLGRIDAKPLPHHQISVRESAWESWGNDPQCLLMGVEYGLRRGWYLIEFLAKADCMVADAKFYFDYGSGYSERDSVFLTYRNGAVSKRLYWLPDRPKSVRLDPLEVPSCFNIEYVRFVRVSTLFASRRMVRRLANRHLRFQGLSEREARQRLKQEARDNHEPLMDRLYRRYAETFTLSHQQRQSYGEWLVLHDWPEYSEPGAVAKEQVEFASRPVFSVVMIIDNPRLPLTRRAIESVCAQSYPDWELLLVSGREAGLVVAGLMEGYTGKDARIKPVSAEKEEAYASAANRGFAVATGDYCFLLDQEDELSPHALHVLAKAINGQLGSRIIYSDEDKIDEDNQRFDPCFKPDWNPDLLLSHNYISRLVAYPLPLVREVGGLRGGFEEGESYDLLLRCVERVRAEEVVHVHKVLYHRRIRREPTTAVEARRAKSQDAGLRALNEHATRTRGNFAVDKGKRSEIFRVLRPVPKPEPLVSLLIPTRDGLHVLDKCVNSILDKTTYSNYEIVILDNQSQKPETHAWFREIVANPKVRILPYDHPFNYSAINNFGVARTSGSIIGLINNDVEVISPEWLTEMVSHAVRPEIGCVGAKLYYSDGTIQHGGVITGIGGVAGHVYRHFPGAHPGYCYRLLVTQNLSVVTAACLLVRREVYNQVGGLNEVDLQVALNDVDFCLKVRAAGYRNLWTPFAELYHHESVSRGADDTPEKQRRFEQEFGYMKRHWSRELPFDPAYNRNLSMTLEDFSLRY